MADKNLKHYVIKLEVWIQGRGTWPRTILKRAANQEEAEQKARKAARRAIPGTPDPDQDPSVGIVYWNKGTSSAMVLSVEKATASEYAALEKFLY